MSGKTDLSQYLEAGILGAGRALFGLPLEHPFDCVKTNQQARGTQGVAATIRAIFAEKGFLGFYAGAIPNSVRAASKQFYRWPMMLGLPPFFRRIVPDSVQTSFPSSVKVGTGLTIASFEAVLITPLERLKVWIMTNRTHQRALRQFFTESIGLKDELLRGVRACYARQVVSWVSFLVADDVFKRQAKWVTGKKELGVADLLVVSSFVGAVNTAANMPFDLVKTRLQMKNPLADKRVFATMRHILATEGAAALYVGWQMRMVQYIMQSAITVPLLDALERKWT